MSREDAVDLSDSSWLHAIQNFVDVNSDAFQEEVDKKIERRNIVRQQEEAEVGLDGFSEKEEFIDIDLLFVLSNPEEDDEEKMYMIITHLLHRGADPSVKDENGETPLHLAVTKNMQSVCTKLLEHGAKADALDNKNKMPFTIALENRNDDIAAMLVRTMKNKSVRKLYSRSEHDKQDDDKHDEHDRLDEHSKKPKFSFHDLLEKEDMPETVTAVLDCMIEPVDKKGKVRVYYNILEADREGKIPSFDSKSQTGLQLIAYLGNKTIVYHDVVRLLTMRKWKNYARRQFLYNLQLNMITLITITFSAIVASTTKDPTMYNIDALQITRGICEVWSLGMTVYILITNIYQIRKHRSDYFQYAFNWVDIASCFLILLLPPLRFTHKNEQWFVFSAAYVFWTIRMLKFATVFRKLGAYVRVLWLIIKHDIVQFTAFFVFILLAFSGCLLLSLRGEGSLEQFSESSTFWSIFFVGIRILIEGERILEYTEFQTISLIIMVGFLFTICIVLLNILIAQVSDTYQNVQQDVQRYFQLHRTLIVTRAEVNTLCFCMAYRNDHYIESEEIDNIGEILRKMDNQPSKNTNQCIQDMCKRLDSYEMEFRTVSIRLSRQEKILDYLKESLNNKGIKEKSLSNPPHVRYSNNLCTSHIKKTYI